MSDTYRPELHVTPKSGILYAPAGAIRTGDTWHVFSQYRPDESSPSRWAHHMRCPATSNRWEPLADVLVPEDGETNLLAGTAINIGQAAQLFFTSVRGDRYRIESATIDDLDATTDELDAPVGAVSSRVRRTGPVVDDSDGLTNFRSPCVIPDWRARQASGTNAGWLMVAVAGPQSAPSIVLLTSKDASHWSLEGTVSFDGDAGLPEDGRIVSPRLLHMKDEVDGQIKDVMLLTIEKDGADDMSGYLVGSLDGTVFHASTPFTRIDFGHDFTRPRATAVSANGWQPDSDQVLIFGLMRPVSRGFDPTQSPSYDAELWDGALSLARLTTLQDGRLFFTPSQLLVDSVNASDSAKAISAVLTVPEGSFVEIAVKDTTDNVVATVTHCGSSLVLDRSFSPHHDDDPAVAPLPPTDTQTLTVIVDRSAIDVIADGGAVAMASRVWMDNPVKGFTLSCGKDATIDRSLIFGSTS